MGIDATSSSTSVSSSSAATQTASASNSDSAKKTSTDSSFKDEMSKVSKSESKKDANDVEKSDSKVTAVSDKKDKESSNTADSKDSSKDDNNLLFGSVESLDYSKFGTMAMTDANTLLSNNILQMMNTNEAQISAASNIEKSGSIFNFDSLNSANSGNTTISMTQDDAQFFINLTQSNDVSAQNISVQAQNMIANGASIAETAQSTKVSQALLEALSNSRENNQPLRVDFDQNVSVILRVGQDGALSARFIPGDKAVEQYLRNNIESLKATFRENDLPYSDLSYSNSSKQQNERRRNKQQQGE